MKNHNIERIYGCIYAIRLVLVSDSPASKTYHNENITRTRIEFAERLSDAVRFFYLFFVAKKVDNMK